MLQRQSGFPKHLRFLPRTYSGLIRILTERRRAELLPVQSRRLR